MVVERLQLSPELTTWKLLESLINSTGEMGRWDEQRRDVWVNLSV
jgi:hypothetical protein